MNRKLGSIAKVAGAPGPGRAIALAGPLLLALAGLACQGREEAAAQQKEQQRQAAWSAIQQAKEGLDAKRQELREARAKVQQARSSGDPALAQVQTALEPLHLEVDKLGDDLNGKLAEFINADPPLVGEPITGLTLEAVRLKSDEDMIVASEYIEEGGDYARAIRIYEDALTADPDNPKLEQALAKAQADRYMTRQRFDLVKKRMTQDEVRGLLGSVNPRNVREHPDQGVVAWFYSKEGGGAAGVYFRKDRGQFLVYQLDFDAVKPAG